MFEKLLDKLIEESDDGAAQVQITLREVPQQFAGACKKYEFGLYELMTLGQQNLQGGSKPVMVKFYFAAKDVLSVALFADPDEQPQIIRPGGPVQYGGASA